MERSLEKSSYDREMAETKRSLCESHDHCHTGKTGNADKKRP
jgi:hypothetical protein